MSSGKEGEARVVTPRFSPSPKVLTLTSGRQPKARNTGRDADISVCRFARCICGI